MWEYPAKVFWQENESKEQLLIFIAHRSKPIDPKAEVAAKALEAILERHATHCNEKPGLNPVKQDRSKPSLAD